MNLNSGQSYLIIKNMLEKLNTSQYRIAAETGVSIAYVNNVVHRLADAGIVTLMRRGCRLKEPISLLERLAFDRPLSRLEIERVRLPLTSIDDVERALAQTCEREGVDYALTAFSGLRRFFEYHIGFPTIHSYVSTSVKGLEQGEGPITLILLRPDHPGILRDATTVNSMRVCDSVQIVIDLYTSGVGRDAAIKYLEAIHRG